MVALGTDPLNVKNYNYPRMTTPRSIQTLPHPGGISVQACLKPRPESSPSPTANPFNPHYNFHCHSRAKTAIASFCPQSLQLSLVVFSIRVASDQLLAFSQLYVNQLWSTRFPTPTRNLPTTTHLPVRFRVRAKLQKRLVTKVGLLAGMEYLA